MMMVTTKTDATTTTLAKGTSPVVLFGASTPRISSTRNAPCSYHTMTTHLAMNDAMVMTPRKPGLRPYLQLPCRATLHRQIHLLDTWATTLHG